VSVTDDAAPEPGATDRSTPERRGHTARNAAIVVGVVLVGLIALLATRGTSQPVSSKIVGQAAPQFAGQTLDGQTFDLASHRGEWVLVNFFATWCTECRLEHPELLEFSRAHQGDPVQVVSVAFDDQADALRTYFAKEGGDWPVIPSDTGRVALDYGVTGVPETYLVAPSGLVIARFEGVSAAQLDQVIDAAGGMAATGAGSS
jgi:cytochrome c biogenesis protein CcmG/thiol:disulfide interchange protein DsbE